MAYFKRFEGGGAAFEDALYDVAHGPSETTNLAADPDFANVRQVLEGQLTAFFATYAEAQADLWSGGVPIQNSARQAQWKNAWRETWHPVFACHTD